MFFAGLGGTAGARASRNPLAAAASSQSAPGKFADHGHTLFVAQRHSRSRSRSRRALRISGTCTASRVSSTLALA